MLINQSQDGAASKDGSEWHQTVDADSMADIEGHQPATVAGSDFDMVAWNMGETPNESQTASSVKQKRCTVRIKPPVAVTHADVTAAVRGGALLQIFVHHDTNCVDVTFVSPDDAVAFLEWAQRSQFYVAGRRVSS